MDISLKLQGFKLMKRITPAILAAFSVFALSLSITSHADNTDSDGFIVFEAQNIEASPAANVEVAEQESSAAAAPAKVEKKAKVKKRASTKAKNKARKRVKRAKRVVRKKRNTRTTRVKRSNNLRKASTYRVRRGDTLYRISVKSGVKLSRLMRLNKIRGNQKHKIQAGQRIRLR